MDINKNHLLTVVSAVVSAAGSKTKGAMPILDNLLIRSDNGTLSATASSLEIESTSQIASDSQDFELLLNAKKLNDILKTSTSDVLKIDVGDKVKIKSGKSRFTMVTDDVESFPFIDGFTPLATINVGGEELKSKLQSVSYAIAQNDVRYYLNGLLIDGCGDHINVVATDGHRLAKTSIDTDSGAEGQWIIPREAVIEIIKMIDGDTTIELSDSKIRVTSGSVTLTSKLIDGRFPDYQRVIPAMVNDSFTVNTKDLRSAINRAVILSNVKYRSILVGIDKNTMTLKAKNLESEESDEEFDIVYDGEKYEIGLNCAYLAEALSNCGNEANFGVIDSNSPAKLEDGESVHILMPMRI